MHFPAPSLSSAYRGIARNWCWGLWQEVVTVATAAKQRQRTAAAKGRTACSAFTLCPPLCDPGLAEQEKKKEATATKQPYLSRRLPASAAGFLSQLWKEEDSVSPHSLSLEDEGEGQPHGDMLGQAAYSCLWHNPGGKTGRKGQGSLTEQHLCAHAHLSCLHPSCLPASPRLGQMAHLGR